MPHVHVEQHWLAFARTPSSVVIQAPFRTFLEWYVEESIEERIVLGPEERATCRTLNHAYSLIEIWRRLVAAADYKVLRLERLALRKENKFDQANALVLKHDQKDDHREGPAYVIARVRIPSGPDPPQRFSCERLPPLNWSRPRPPPSSISAASPC